MSGHCRKLYHGWVNAKIRDLTVDTRRRWFTREWRSVFRVTELTRIMGCQCVCITSCWWSRSLIFTDLKRKSGHHDTRCPVVVSTPTTQVPFRASRSMVSHLKASCTAISSSLLLFITPELLTLREERRIVLEVKGLVLSYSLLRHGKVTLDCETRWQLYYHCSLNVKYLNK